MANDVGYNLLTRGDDVPAGLALGARLTVKGFDNHPDLAKAESLLCAALRIPDAVPPDQRHAALGQLLDINEAAPKEDLLNLAYLLFDARRFGGTDVLNAWLADVLETLRTGPAGQWLAARLTTDQLAAATPFTSKLDESLEKIAIDLAAEDAWAARHAHAGTKLAELAERVLEDASEPATGDGVELETLLASLSADDPLKQLLEQFAQRE